MKKVTPRATAKARLRKITMEEYYEDLRAKGIDKESEIFGLEQKTEKLREEMERLLKSGGYIKILNGEVCRYFQPTKEDISEPTKAMVDEIRRLKAEEGFIVNAAELVDNIREKSEDLIFCLVGDKDYCDVHVTSTNMSKIVYVIDNTVEKEILRKISENPEKIGWLRKNHMIKRLLEDRFEVKISRAVKGYYIPHIRRDRTGWEITIQCLVDEDGNM